MTKNYVVVTDVRDTEVNNKPKHGVDLRSRTKKADPAFTVELQ